MPLLLTFFCVSSTSPWKPTFTLLPNLKITTVLPICSQDEVPASQLTRFPTVLLFSQYLHFPLVALVNVAVHGPSLAVVLVGSSPAGSAQASHCCGLVQHSGSGPAGSDHMEPVLLRGMWNLSDQNRTCVPCVGRQVLFHCASEEVPLKP